MRRSAIGASAGILGTLVVLFLWAEFVLPTRLTPQIGFHMFMSLMTSGVLLTGVAAFLHSKWWLLMFAASIVTFVLFYIAAMA